MLINRIRRFLVRIGYSSNADFLIVGAQKCGTTALFAMLKQHPKLVSSYKKEIHFFDDDEHYKTNAHHQLNYYFPLPHKVKKNSLLYSATPSYLYHPEAPKRIKAYNPEMKIIVLLRDPAARVLSAWMMYHYDVKQYRQFVHLEDRRSLREIIISDYNNLKSSDWGNDQRAYLKRGFYSEQLKRYLDCFPAKNILVLEQGELLNRHERTMKLIFEFLEVQEVKVKQEILMESRGKNKENFASETRFLKEFYYAPNEELFNLLGKRYNWNDNVDADQSITSSFANLSNNCF